MPSPDTLTPARTSPLRRQTARVLLLGTCAAGLVGLAVPGHHSTEHLRAAASSEPALFASAPALIQPRAEVAPRHGGLVRASRSRSAAPKRVTVTTKPAAPPVTLWVRPNAGPITSPYGMRWGKLHAGIDFGGGYGSPIYAIGNGVVVGVGYQAEESGYGQITIIAHPDGFYSAYAHQSSYVVQLGEHVTAGEVIGYVGATGEVTGPHLHFEIRTALHGHQIDPAPWLAAHGVDV